MTTLKTQAFLLYKTFLNLLILPGGLFSLLVEGEKKQETEHAYPHT